MKIFATLISIVFFSQPIFASDHIDGPVTTAHRVADLTDLFAYPTPKKPGFLSIILNAYPIVSPAGHFTDKVNYNVILRKAAVKGDGDNFFFQTSDEIVINCTFKTPDITADHVVMCKASNGLSATSKYEEVADQSVTGDFRLYAGMRSDPFFFNSDWATSASAKGVLLKPKNKDVMADINALSIVMEIDMNKFFRGHSLFAIAAETTTQDSPTSPLRRLDRVGRPEITNVSMVSHAGDAELRDTYNTDQPFRVSAANMQSYQERLAKNISFYDNIDKKADWQDRDRQHLATVLADDFLVVDISKSCETDAFFNIEKSLLLNKNHETCGGRKPTDDIMDTLFTLYIAGLNGARIRDGVDKPSHKINDEFPYLAAPELGFFARTKAYFARMALGLSD